MFVQRIMMLTFSDHVYYEAAYTNPVHLTSRPTPPKLIHSVSVTGAWGWGGYYNLNVLFIDDKFAIVLRCLYYIYVFSILRHLEYK
jgi:hypothetical protein